MTPALISCIVPVFNGEAYVGEAVESVLTQTYSPIEVIVVDDGSVDGTRAVVERFGNRVRYVYQENAGHAAARNRGQQAANGEFVAFLDADDLWHREKLQRQMDLFHRRPALDASVTLVRNFWSAEIPMPERQPPDAEIAAPVAGYRSVTLLARRRVFEQIGPFDPHLLHGNDTDWFLRAIEQGITIALVPEVLVDRRLHAANRSRRLAANSHREYLRIVKASLDRRRRPHQAGVKPLMATTIDNL